MHGSCVARCHTTAATVDGTHTGYLTAGHLTTSVYMLTFIRTVRIGKDGI
jgi:hypothetical protein